MKQFQYTKPGGTTYGPFSESDVADIVSAGHVPGWAHTAPIGDTCEDSDDDVWTRLPDLGEAPIVVTDQTPRDERLERIALAYLAVIGPAYFNGMQLEEGVSLSASCVYNARCLIAELDKQA
jgi:hypothetical protein